MPAKWIFAPVLIFAFLNNAHAAWTCWARPGEKPSALAMPNTCKGMPGPKLICRQSAYCANITATMRENINQQWNNYRAHQEEFDNAMGEFTTQMPPEQIILALQNNPYYAASKDELQHWEARLNQKEFKLLDENKIETEVTCPGKPGKDSDSAECPPPDKCFGGRIVAIKSAKTVVGGFTEQPAILPDVKVIR